MPAHLRDIVQVCQWSSCTNRASVRLHNTWNEPLGDYCRRHGEAALRQLEDASRAGRAMFKDYR